MGGCNFINLRIPLDLISFLYCPRDGSAQFGDCFRENLKNEIFFRRAVQTFKNECG